MQKKRKFIFLIVSLLLVSLSLSFAPYAHADIHNGTRSFYGVKYDSSAQTKTFRHNEKTYNYRDIYDTARFRWNNRSGINLTKNSHSWSDVYYVGTTSDSGLLGRVYPLNGSLDFVSMDSYWLFVKVYIYDNTMNNFKMSPNQRSSNATHEVGHTVKMKHPTSYTGSSVMRQGIQSIGPTSYDYS